MRLVLHVGLPKTGSTHLQAQVFRHREALGALGLGVTATATRGYWRPPYNLARELMGDPAFDPGLGTWQDLATELRGMQEPVALVSCEMLASCIGDADRLERLAGVAAEAGRSLTILAVVREPIGWMNSTYQQNVRDFAVTERFDPFRRRLLAEGALDFGAIFRPVVEDARIELVAVPHERARAEGPLVFLMESLGLDAEATRRLPIVEGRENVSVGPLTLEVARLVGLALQARVPGFSIQYPRDRNLRRTFRSLAQDAGWNTRPFWGWSEAAVGETLVSLAPSLDAFAQRMWGTPWPDPSPQGREQNVADLSAIDGDEAARVMEVVARMHSLIQGPDPTGAEPPPEPTRSVRGPIGAARARIRAARGGDRR